MPKMLGATLCDRKTGDILGRVDFNNKTRALYGDGLSRISSGQEVTLLVDAPGREMRLIGVVVCCKNGNVRWQFEENRK